MFPERAIGSAQEQEQMVRLAQTWSWFGPDAVLDVDLHLLQYICSRSSTLNVVVEFS